MDDEQPQLPTEQDDSKSSGPPASRITSGELLSMALEVYKDLMLNAKNEKVRLEAANAVTELEGMRGKATPNVGFTFNVPPEYLSRSLKALGTLRISHEEVIDVGKDSKDAS